MAKEAGQRITFKTPIYEPDDDDGAIGITRSARSLSSSSASLRASSLKQRNKADEEATVPPVVQAHRPYLGSYAHSTPQILVDVNVDQNQAALTPRASTSHLQLEHLLQAVDADLETYGVEELRDGFFDAYFSQPSNRHQEDTAGKVNSTIAKPTQKPASLPHRYSLFEQMHESQDFFCRITTSREGINLAKSFLGFFITYIICLIPASRDWLGRYNYMIAISAIVNHPGRAVGSQVDGAFLTIVGTVAGLGWGYLALYVSTSTSAAQSGYGGILAAYLVIFAVMIGWLRCFFIRFYQAVLAAGIAICYTCLADTSVTVGWRKVFDYGIPWMLGQVICLLVAVLVFPDAGYRSLTLSLRESLLIIQDGLSLPRKDCSMLRQRLAWQFVNVSQAVRDFTIEPTLSRFDAQDIRNTRNLIQGVIRSILAIRADTKLFAISDTLTPLSSNIRSNKGSLGSDDRAIRLVCTYLKAPTRSLIDAMTACIQEAEHTVMTIGGQRHSNDPSNLCHSLEHLRSAKITFDSADADLIAHPELPSTYAKSPDIVELLLFIHPVRQTADKIEDLTAKILQIQNTNRGWHIRGASYPFKKSIMRTNPQVRHDRGGLTAGFYFRSQKQLDDTMADLRSTVYVPTIRHDDAGVASIPVPIPGEHRQDQVMNSSLTSNVSQKAKFRYRVWEMLHRLQGFESRFAFKVTLVTTLISIPAWLPQSRDWWNEYDSWWAVVTVWIVMHPHVGGTLQDLVVRCFFATIGAIWGGFAYAAGKGNPYVMAVFAAMYMLPLTYRFTQSSHPRSGAVGCISFTVVSLSAYTNTAQASIVRIAWTRGLAFIIGIVAALVVNWVLWPFVARHELRKSLATMMLHSAIIYRGVIAKYIYYNKGEAPSPEDIARSEMLEGRLREGFVRMRQLMELTKHEIRLRGPFNPLPYSGLITACESFFEHLVQIRQSALYFQPSMLRTDDAVAASLTAPRRDAVAVVFMNLYVLACALRADQPVPKYLPSAAVARRKLLDRMEALEVEQSDKRKAIGTAPGHDERQRRRWADVYQYAFNSALTENVKQLQELQKYTREICGETAWDVEQ